MVDASKNRRGLSVDLLFVPRTACIQKLANLASEGFLGERLVKQMRTGFKYAMTGYKAIRVSGHVEDFHLWLSESQAFAKNAAIHSRHDDIRK